MTKKKILWSSEASFLNTGFSTLSYEILKYLYSTGKYDIVEYGSYAKTSDQKALGLPWKFYGATPEDHDQDGQKRYSGSAFGQFGETFFETILLNERIQLLTDNRDAWMCSNWQLYSPYRRYTKVLYMPTVDGAPQRKLWLDEYAQADGILTYSQFGKDTLENESNNNIKVMGVVRPGVDHNVFKPLNKKELRNKYGIPSDANVILTVMRNQKRKLFPDLIEAFAEFIKYAHTHGDKNLANNTYLLLHTSYPDVGFDIPRHIVQNGVSHRVLVSYVCDNCKTNSVSYFNGEIAPCYKCGAYAAHMPNTRNGHSREQLAEVYNISDLYIQYAICEGLGMGVCEAKACGIPSMAVDYSAMSEQVKDIYGCWPIAVERMFHESVMETEQLRAMPSQRDTIRKIYEFFKLSQSTKDLMAKSVRDDAVKNYSFERAAKIYEQAFDAIDVDDISKTWLTQDITMYPNKIDEIKDDNSSIRFVDNCINAILGPKFKYTRFWRNRLAKAIDCGVLENPQNRMQFNKNVCVKYLSDIAQKNNYWEQIRLAQFMPRTKPQWIQV